ncbi:phosphodiester glycosidase family protein [Pedobacter metabolipauper]|uniref:Uncharacterized protein DUF2233 n=1 Tax=Pedobacter metabolipauper TaxID=425513 RepID=A0A4R6SW23_9SPHI|nr:phosphodiester glycosidase family protein [Pedobacter metabolipauper]TDQ09576.1 uncharacterized protein DUF2233 [Pedobacter metabolipauper]
MLRKIHILLVISLCNCAAFSQNADSVTFVNTKWNKARIAKKVRLMTHHFSTKNLFNDNQNISYVEIKNTGNYPAFDIANEVKELKTTSAFGKQHNAILALNGTFFDVKNGGSVDFVKVNGTIEALNRTEKNKIRARHQKAAIVINRGKLALKKWDGTDNWESNLTDESILVTGPLLSLERVEERLDSSAFNTDRHPRTAIGIKPDGKIILLTVDGRNANSAGMSLAELTKTMKWLGCSSSINLDGGGSTTLWVQGFPDNGIINYPTDNKLWDHSGERKVANVIILTKKP